MPRFTNTEDGAAKFWEIAVDGASVTVRFGKIGTAGQTKTKVHPSAAAAERDAEKLIREKTAKGYLPAGDSPSPETPPAPAEAETSPAPADAGAPSSPAEPASAAPPAEPKKPRAKSPAKKSAPAASAVPPWRDLDEKALRKLAQKISKNPKIDQYKVSHLATEANGDDWGAIPEVLWHLVTHGLLQPERIQGVLTLLDEHPEGGSPATIFELFVRMGPHLERIAKDWTEYAPGVPMFVDRLMVNAWERDSALFESRKAELDPRLQLALASIRRRFERDIDPADAERMLDHLAKQLSIGNMTGNNDFWLSRGGERVAHRLNGEDALIEVAALYGSKEDFLRRVVVHALTAPDPAVRHMTQALHAADLTDAAEIFARRFSWSDCPSCELEFTILDGRDDPPEALFEAAKSVVPGKTRGEYDSDDPESPARHRLSIRDNLLALGAARFASAGKEVPATFEELYQFEALSDVYHPTIPRHLAAFRALPRDRALALADGLIAKDCNLGAAAVILAAHPDDGRRATLLAKQLAGAWIGARYWGLHGAEVLPLLDADLPALKPDQQRWRHEAMLHCLVHAARQGTTVDPSWAKLLRWDSTGPEPLKYWSPSTDGALRDDALAAFSPETVRAVLLRAAADEKFPVRLLGSRHVRKDDKALVVAIVDEVVRREGARCDHGPLAAAYTALGETFVDALCDAVGRLGTDAAFLDLIRRPLSHKDGERVTAAVKGGVESLHDLFLRKAKSAPGDKVRVYALDTDGDDGFTARPGSFSRIGGSVPGLAPADYPSADGEPMTPLLTLDLDEVPELGAKYPGARLLVLFHPDPQGGEDHESACLVPVPRDAVAAPGDGQSLAVTPIDLPVSVFADEHGNRDDSPDTADLRRQLRKRGGHLFGGPFWIQEAEGGSDGFLFELRDGLCDLNLGDVGSLYAYEGDQFTFQCH